MAPVELSDDRLGFFVDEFAGQLLEGYLFFGELEINHAGGLLFLLPRVRMGPAEPHRTGETIFSEFAQPNSPGRIFCPNRLSEPLRPDRF
jgi:hypothetical protein